MMISQWLSLKKISKKNRTNAMIIGDYDKDYCMETSDIFLKYYLNNFKMKWDQASKLADYR